MVTRNPRVDAYIADAAPFARPILERLRSVVHAACPGVEEDIKWGCPHFLYKGMFCNMAAFKHHCAFGFWHGAQVLGDAFRHGAMGSFGRITSMTDLPARPVLAGYVRRARALKDEGALTRPARRRRSTPALRVPPDFAKALTGRPKAMFAKLSPSHRREYVEWITSAKREETRKRRIATAVAWIAEGKSQNWKYERR